MIYYKRKEVRFWDISFSREFIVTADFMKRHDVKINDQIFTEYSGELQKEVDQHNIMEKLRG
jgi:hypothetical protein